jgi:uncharacterized surface protein with fasciclin (FAS1) repeats
MDLIQSQNKYSTLSRAVVAAEEAEEVYDSQSPLTLFAATNSAFNAMGADYIEMLIENENYGVHLRNLVRTFITGDAAYLSTDLTDGLMFNMVNEESVVISVANNQIQLETLANRLGLADPIPVTQADTLATNGVLHEVDAVVAPFWIYVDTFMVMRDLVSPRFSILFDLLTLAGLDDELAGFNDVTVALPVNAAFDALSSETLEFLVNPLNVDTLRAVLLYHVLPAQVINVATLPLGETPQETLLGQDVTITLELLPDGSNVRIFFDEAESETIFLLRTNIIYQISSVMIPDGYDIP